MKALFKSIVPLLFILLFTYAAASKLLDFGRFRLQLYRQPFPRGISDLLVYLLPVTELLLALLLCFRRSRFAALVLSTGLMAVFTAYISLVLLHYWGDVPCSCGGILSHMSWTAHLAFNWAFVLAGVTGIALHLSDRKQKQLTSTR
jgi:putative oxidoreductase